MKRKGYQGRQAGRSGNIKRRRIDNYQFQSTQRQLRNQDTLLLKRRLQLELKGMDTIMPSGTGTSGYLSTTNTNGDITVLNLVQTGNGSWNRVGKAIKMKSLRIQGSLQSSLFNSTGIVYNNYVRMVVVYDRQPSSGAIPTFDTIFGRTDQTGTENSRITDPLRYDNVGRFRVLCDKVIDFNASSSDDSDLQRVAYHVDEYINLRGLETIYSGQSNPMTIADISSGALYIVFRSLRDSGTTAFAEPLQLATRLRYYD